MNTGSIIYLTLTGIMMFWALRLCFEILFSGEDDPISFGEIVSIVIFTGLCWPILALFGIAYMIAHERRAFKRGKTF